MMSRAVLRTSSCSWCLRAADGAAGGCQRARAPVPLPAIAASSVRRQPALVVPLPAPLNHTGSLARVVPTRSAKAGGFFWFSPPAATPPRPPLPLSGSAGPLFATAHRGLPHLINICLVPTDSLFPCCLSRSLLLVL